MKRTIIYLLSGVVLSAVVIGLLPPVYAESQDEVPQDSNDDSPVIEVSEPYTFTISATDADNDPLIYSAHNLPPGATFDPETRTFSWTPTHDQAGTYTNIRFEVSDGILTDSEEITITVIDEDRPPVLEFIGDKLANEGDLIEFEINAHDPDNDPLIYSATNLPPRSKF